MVRSKPFTMLAVLIFAVVAVVHLFRLYSHFRVELGTHMVPDWVSIFGALIAGVLAVMVYRESRN